MIYFQAVMTKVVLYFQAATLRSKAWRDKLAGIYSFATKAHWQVQMVPSGATPEDIQYMLDSWKPIGCIIDQSLSNARHRTALFHGLPVVLMEQDPATNTSNCSCVVHDSRATASLAAKELLKSGIEAYSYVPYGLTVQWNSAREKGFAAAIRSHGKTFVPWGKTPFSNALKPQQQDRLLAERLCQLPHPIGLLCANDQIAQRVFSVAAKVGLDIPGDLAVVGVDNDDFICDNLRPTLSSVLPDFHGGGYQAARLLDRAIRHPDAPPASVSYGPLELVRRQSTQFSALEKPIIARARALILQRACDPAFHTADLTDELGCSRSLLELRFRQATGRTIRDEIQRLRFEKALALLRNPRQAITPIPSLCGYASEAFFKRLFKRSTGLSMREWRQRNAARD